MLRVIAIAFTLFLFAGTALADDWKEYKNRDYSFTVDFPASPTIETATYEAAEGRSFPAHVFSVKQKNAEFKVTVVDMPGEKSGSDASVMKEASKVAAGTGTIKFDALHRIRGSIGRQLGIAGANGGYSYVSLFYRNNHLYEVEGAAFAAGEEVEIEARRFQQSFDLT
jgi:hypothetical protein